MLDNATIAKYQPGGEFYNRLAGQYGSQGADAIAQAALTGDRTKITDAIVAVRFGQPLEENTNHIFLDQLATNPLGAPLEAADKGLQQIFASTTGKVVAVVAVVTVVTILVVKLK